MSKIYFNGIDGEISAYLFPPESENSILGFPDWTDDPLARFYHDLNRKKRRTIDGVDDKTPREAGWGIVFPAEPKRRVHYRRVQEALAPLLDLRKREAGPRFKEFADQDGYFPGETTALFLGRHGAAPGPVNPEHVPYYLLLVGSPEEIPFPFQTHLSVQYAVGRLYFDEVEDYERYAVSVSVQVQKESGKPLPVLTLFGPSCPTDPPTVQSAKELIGGIQRAIPREKSEIRVLTGREAGRARLAALMGGLERPDILFTAGHGLGWPLGHAKQRNHQGSLLCGDWPGPDHTMKHEHIFGAADVREDAQLDGLICFFFACFGLGTPTHCHFHVNEDGSKKPVAARPFISRLPQRLLAHENGGALAVIGHVDRTFGSSFQWYEKTHIETFTECLNRLLAGNPLGYALAPFSLRFTQLNAQISEMRETATCFRQARLEGEIARLMWAALDARNFAVLGDPAVCLPGVIKK